MSRESLLLLCQHYGLDPGYQDIWGRQVEALPEVIQAALTSVSGGEIPHAAYSDLAAAEAWLERRRATRWLPGPVLAASQSAPLAELRLPPGDYSLRIRWEDGSSFACRIAAMPDTALEWPADSPCPVGYHQLEIQQGERSESYVWILSPGRIWEEASGGRAYGVTCFLPSLRSTRNWGCGDFSDLVEFARQFRDAGFDYIALNPLHALANRLPYNTSPYSPLSLLRLNFLYLALEELPEFTGCTSLQLLQQQPTWQARLESLRESEYVDYEGIARTKRLALKLLYRHFLRQPDPAFAAWRASREPWLQQYGAYIALWDYLHKRNPQMWIWQDWPEPYRDFHSPECRALLARLQSKIDFEAWVQWRLEQQLEATAEKVRSLGYRLGLYSDLAVACDKAGPDRWANASLFAQGLRIGSPPDDFNANGQDWGFPALRPVPHCLEAWQYFRESLRACARSAGIIRLDHVMRLARLYSIPDGFPASQGVYVRDHFRALLHTIALESQRHRVLVVGEDLGTVPEYFRSALEEFGILSYRLVMFEWHGSELKPAEHYPHKALCAFSTHDLATFDGYLQAADLDLRRKVGFLGEEAYAGALDERRRSLAALQRAFRAAPESVNSDEAFAHLAAFLLRTPCQLVLLGLDELLAERTQMNLPGTTVEHPNWRLKTRLRLEDFGADGTLQRRRAAWRTAREQAGR